MSRSAADATRFTATGPYASSKPNAGTAPYKLPGSMTGQRGQQGNSQSGASQGGRPETPKEKVERLRAQARAARAAQSTSRVDSMIESGRRVANKAHKVMVYSLIAASGVCGALTVYSVISLTLYNRRQKQLWIDSELQKLKDAQLACESGSATAEQMEIVKNEKIGEIMKRNREEAKAQRPWNQLKRYIFGGLENEEAPKLEAAAKSEGDKPGVLEALNAKAMEEAKALEAGAGHSQSQSPAQSGQLDNLAQNAEAAATQTTRSWKSWFTGR